MKGLLDTLEQDCRDWISSYQQLFMNECHMQLELAFYLKQNPYYDEVHVEYAVPLQFMKGKLGDSLVQKKLRIKKKAAQNTKKNPMDNTIYIDIVVRRGKKFAAVELKYATYSIEDELPVFGEQNTYEIITKTGAYDKKHYLYWYDVCRIEALTKFHNVVGGVALIVSNDYTYWRGPERQSAYSPFSTREKNTVGGDLKWAKTQKGETCEMKNSHPALHLDYSYYCHWEKTKIQYFASKKKEKMPNEDRVFRYMMSVIPAKSIKQQKQEAEKRKKHNRQND